MRYFVLLLFFPLLVGAQTRVDSLEERIDFLEKIVVNFNERLTVLEDTISFSYVPGDPPQLGYGYSVAFVEHKGQIITLNDRSVWKIPGNGSLVTAKWQRGENVFLTDRNTISTNDPYKHFVNNGTRGESWEARFIGYRAQGPSRAQTSSRP